MKLIILLSSLITVLSLITSRAQSVTADKEALLRGITFHGQVWQNETGFRNLGFQTCRKQIYNIIFLGRRNGHAHPGLTIGTGFGKHQPIGKSMYSSIDWTAQIITTAITDGTMFRFRFMFGRTFLNGISVFGGPVYASFTDDHDDGGHLAPWISSLQRKKGYYRRNWFGLVAGIRY